MQRTEEMGVYQRENGPVVPEDRLSAEDFLLAKAAEQGFVTYGDIVDLFPNAEENLQELEDLLTTLSESGIEVADADAWDGDGDEAAALFRAAEEDADLTECSNVIAQDDITGLYLREIGRVSLLTAEQEVALGQRIEAGRIAHRRLKDGHLPEERPELERAVMDGLAAREHLVCANFRLVVSVAKKYANRGVPFLDLIQEGNIGLMRAAKRFDHHLGLRFSTYATWWIRQAVTRAIADQGRTIRVPVHMSDQISKLLRTTNQLSQHLGREPDVGELAVAMDTPKRKVLQMIDAMRVPMSLDMPVGDEEESELGDFVADEGSPMDDEIARSTLRDLLTTLVADLPPREARILQLRYGLVNGQVHTLEQVGNKLGVTRERVRQLEAQALRRLRHPTHSRRLQDFMP
jgi:RNA polymerase primary sigma factor